MNSLFQPELVKIVDEFDSKASCLSFLTSMLEESGCLKFPNRFLAAVQGREEIMSTGIGRGVAIPHARDLTVTHLRIAVCLIRKPLEFQSLDELPVQIVFMIAVPQNSNKEYMSLLRSLSEHLRQKEHREKLINAKDEMELYNEITKIEEIIPALGSA
jgi:fructose-specific phosphotransferase system IIA component